MILPAGVYDVSRVVIAVNGKYHATLSCKMSKGDDAVANVFWFPWEKLWGIKSLEQKADIKYDKFVAKLQRRNAKRFRDIAIEDRFRRKASDKRAEKDETLHL